VALSEKILTKDLIKINTLLGYGRRFQWGHH